jgi:hypothetical protein
MVKDSDVSLSLIKKSFEVGGANYLSLLLFALLVCTYVITSFHHHANLQVYANCIICKVAHDLSCADRATPFLLLMVPEVVKQGFVVETTWHILAKVTFSRSPRAPPLPAMFPNK